MKFTVLPLLLPVALGLGVTPDAGDNPVPGLVLPSDTMPTAPTAWSSFWWGDYDADGLRDAFVLAPGGVAKLLHNRGDGTLEDASDSLAVPALAGIHMALWEDYDGDGRLDLFLAGWGAPSRLLRQTQGGIFVDASEPAGIEAAANPVDAEWIDYDADGWTDLRLATLHGDFLYRNAGNGTFARIELELDGLGAGAAMSGAVPSDLDEARRVRGLGPAAPGAPRDGGPSSGAAGSSGVGAVPPPNYNAGMAICASFLEDQANPGTCMPASSTPTLGMLYPLSADFYVDAATRNVGIGTVSPVTKLDVAGGDIRTDSMLISTASSGPPLSVQSNTKVTNLNADLLDGLNSSVFSQLGNSIEGVEITDGTVAAVDLASNAVTSAKIAANAVTSTKLAGGSVTAGKIAAGTVTNADVNGAAGIAGTKISPSFGAQHVTTSRQLVSTTTGEPPLQVTSTQRVPNLNADLLDGLHSSVFSQLGTSIEGSEITNGTVAAADLASNAVTSAKIAGNAVTSTKLAVGSVTAGKIAAGTVTNADVANSAAIAGTKISPSFGSQTVSTGGQLVTTTTGQPPLAVSSAQKVVNFNADLLDGLDSSVFTTLGNSIEGNEITNGTIQAVDLASPLTGSGLPNVIEAWATGNGGLAVLGRTTATTGFGFGVQGESASSSGKGVYGFATSATGSTYGVHGRSDSPGGTGLYGEAPAATGDSCGVDGRALSGTGMGVYGYNLATTGDAFGVVGENGSSDGTAVYGHTTSASGSTIAVHGQADSASGTGVYGEGGWAGLHGKGNLGVRGESDGAYMPGMFGVGNGTAGYGVFGIATADGTFNDGELSAGVFGGASGVGDRSCGVYGSTGSEYGYAIYARAWSTTGTAKGVYAETAAPSGDAIYGKATSLTGSAWGVRGETWSAGGYGVFSSGDFGGTGAKYFVQPHPEDPGKEIRFVCLEGNESGTYFRGSTRTLGGQAVIEVPEEFRLVSESEGLTVMVTAVGSPARLWVQAKGLNTIVVKSDLDTEFDYFVNGVRRGFADFDPVRENQSFVPTTRGVEYGTQYPDALRAILVENGILQPDFTPDEDTAAGQGWTLQDPAPEGAASRRAIAEGTRD